MFETLDYTMKAYVGHSQGVYITNYLKTLK